MKNIAFLMDKAGKWSLSPAFDVTYAYNPEGAWTSRHQMTLTARRTDLPWRTSGIAHASRASNAVAIRKFWPKWSVP